VRANPPWHPLILVEAFFREPHGWLTASRPLWDAGGEGAFVDCFGELKAGAGASSPGLLCWNGCKVRCPSFLAFIIRRPIDQDLDGLLRRTTPMPIRALPAKGFVGVQTKRAAHSLHLLYYPHLKGDYRLRSAERVVDEIESVIQRQRAIISFHDNVFNCPPTMPCHLRTAIRAKPRPNGWPSAIRLV